ncbi:MAG: ribulose-phosphate 3-epimerase [Acidimicrobiia bacterium]|nr:ribulose-phosphate 3-epimerase [Acidimicrobiia bacterium]
MKLAPSILSADFADLAAEVERVAAEADLLHVDVMDGHFVPNLTIGPPVVKSLRKRTDLFLDCHLMVDNPGVLLDDFAEAGADGITIHVELGDPTPLLARIRALDMRAGLVLSPPTPFEAVAPYLDRIDLLLVMSVNPGWGGQEFIPEVLTKVAAARRIVDERGLPVEIEIDGGINVETAPAATRAGVDILVAGSAIFHAENPLAAARRIREAGWPRSS